jgi:hypothetical protein
MIYVVTSILLNYEPVDVEINYLGTIFLGYVHTYLTYIRGLRGVWTAASCTVNY